MTTLDDRARAVEHDRTARAEDFWDDLMPEAAHLVVTAGYGSVAMLQRKTRLPHAVVTDLLAELHDAGVLGPKQDGQRKALVGEDELADVLARLAAAGAEPVVVEPPPVESAPAVSLVKAPRPDVLDAEEVEDLEDEWGDEEGQGPGSELVRRVFGRLAPRQSAELATLDSEPQTLVVRVRQAAARQSVWLIDQPVAIRGVTVTRQLPRATWRLASCTPRGARRITIAGVDWLRDARSAELLAKHADAGEGESYAKVARARLEANLAGRRALAGGLAAVVALVLLAWLAPGAFGGVLGVAAFIGAATLAPRGDLQEWLWGLAFATALAGAAWWFGPDLAGLVPRPPVWAWWVPAGVALLACAVAGRREDQPLVEMPARMVPHKTPPLTAPMVTAALCALGNSKMREPDDITLLMDVARHGQGYQIDLELPPAVPATDIIEKREELAAALRRELGTVWPAVGARHPGHLSLFVSDVAMVSATQAPWPLATGGAVSLFQPLPLFTDQRGQWVYQTLAYTAWVIGAVPRMGKTRGLLGLGLAAALDVRAKLFVFDLKGTGDLSSLAKVAHRYRVGDEPEDIAEMLAIMRSIRQEMRTRTRLVRELTLEENPDRGKVTDALASRDADKFGPIVVLVDEVQVWTQEFSEALPDQVHEGKPPKDPGKVVRDEFVAILRDLVKRGPALGIIPKLATQKPDAKSIPSSIADNASARLCLKVNGQISNDQILGTSSYQAGIRATQFAFSDKGIAFFRGDGAEPLVVRTVDITPERADQIASRARALRLAAGRLTGEANDEGIEDAVVVADIVEDVEQVLDARVRDRAHHVEVVEWLRDLRPEDYAALDVEELSARLRAREVKVSQVRIGGINRKGVRLGNLRKRDFEGERA